MLENQYKHYIKTTTKQNIPFITQGFCDAFETPTETDIFVEDSEIRQYNPDLYDGLFNPKFKWDDGFVELTEAEKQIWIDSLPKPEPTTEEKLSAVQNALDELILGGI